jgi:hypothetical protein
MKPSWSLVTALVSVAVSLPAVVRGQSPARPAPVPSAAALPRTAPTRRVYLPRAEQSLPPGSDVVLVTLPLMRLAPGETRFLEGRLAAWSDTPRPVEQKLAIDCGSPGVQIRSSRNHEGRDYPQVGDGYVRASGGRPVLTIVARYLFTAPRDAPRRADYSCTLRGEGGTNVPAAGLTAVRAVTDDGREVTGTWLEVVDEDKRGAHWVDMTSTQTAEHNCQPGDLYQRCQPRSCLSGDTDPIAQCQYVFPAIEPRSERILEMKAAKADLLPRWSPGGTATVYTDFELTSCYLQDNNRVSASCSPSVKPQAKRRRDNVHADVLYRLEVAELDATGKPDNCVGPNDSPRSPGWTYSPAPGHGFDRGDYARETIRDDAHHKKFYRQLIRRLSTNPECTRMLVRVYVRAARGHPIKLDANRITASGRHAAAFTNGIIWLATPERGAPVRP